jgi:chromosome partitioning protein
MGKIIAISSQKGGVGKTTTAINLGASLAIFQKKVLIVDLDPQGSIAASFHLDEFKVQYGLFQVIKDKIPLVMAITDIGLENFEIVPSGVRDDEDEMDMFTYALQPELLKSILKPLKEIYDFIILDCPPSLGSITKNAIIAADSILIPVQTEFYAVKALGKFLKAIRKFAREGNPSLKLEGVLVTMYEKRIKNNQKMYKDLKSSLRSLVFDVVIPRNSKIAEAPSVGKPVALLDVSSAGSVSYLKLAEELLNRN